MAFIRILPYITLPDPYQEHLLKLIFDIIDTETLSLQDIWAQVFSQLSQQLSKRLISGRWSNELFNLANFSKPDHIRSIAGQMLGFLGESNLNQDINKKIYSMSQDPSNLVRKRMCVALKAISKTMPKNQLENELFPQVLLLFNDEADEVLEASLPVFCEITEKINSQASFTQILTFLREGLLSSTNFKVKEAYLKYFGQIIVDLRFQLDDTTKLQCIDWFLEFERTNNAKKWMVFNFPAILLLADGFNKKILSVFAALSNDEDPEIKKSLAKQLGDNSKFLNHLSQEYIIIVRNYLANQLTQRLVIPQLFLISNHTNHQQEFWDFLNLKLTQTKN